MSTYTHGPAVPGKGMKDNGQLATWLGLISFTFLFATFIASNVYLRGWSSETFSVKLSTPLQNVVNITMLFTILAGILSLGVGISYKKRNNTLFSSFLILTGVSFLADIILTWVLINQYKAMGAAPWTTYGMVEIFMLALHVVSFVFFSFGLVYMLRNKGGVLNRFIPASLSVWIYTVLMGIIVFIQCNLVQIGQFAEWCGLKVN